MRAMEFQIYSKVQQARNKAAYLGIEDKVKITLYIGRKQYRDIRMESSSLYYSDITGTTILGCDFIEVSKDDYLEAKAELI